MLPIAALRAALVMLGSSFGAQSGATVVATLSKSTAPTQIARPQTVVGSGGSWAMYHHDDAHTGTAPPAPALPAVHPSAGWTETAPHQDVYPQPPTFHRPRLPP